VTSWVKSCSINVSDCSFSFTVTSLAGVEVYPLLWPKCKGISIRQSAIDFYVNGTLVSDLKCSKELVINPNGSSLFNLFSSIEFANNVNYPSTPICMHIFTESKLNKIFISNQIDAILINNLFKFHPIDQEDDETSIKSNISRLIVHGYGFTLDTSFMNPLVFELIERVDVYLSIGAIQTDLFKHFVHINALYFSLNSLTNLFHRTGIAWTLYLPNNTSIDLYFTQEEPLNYIIEIVNPYLYPDADFCIFADWPQLHTELKEKKKRLGENATTAPISFRRKRKHQIEESAEGRAILMVVFNCALNFILRLPELFFIFTVSHTLFKKMCNYLDGSLFPNFSQITTDLTYLCYVLTFSTNFAVYYLFNQKFKQTFSEMRNVKKKD
jgi:hypothetical protein